MVTFSTAHYLFGVGNSGRTFNLNRQMVNIQKETTSINYYYTLNKKMQQISNTFDVHISTQFLLFQSKRFNN